MRRLRKRRRRSQTDMSRDTRRYLLLQRFASKELLLWLHIFLIITRYFPKDFRTEHIDLLRCTNECFNASVMLRRTHAKMSLFCHLNHVLFSSSLSIRALSHKRVQFVVLLNLFFSLAFFRPGTRGFLSS